MPTEQPSVEWLFYIPKTDELIIVKSSFGVITGCDRGGETLDGTATIQLNRKHGPFVFLDVWNAE